MHKAPAAFLLFIVAAWTAQAAEDAPPPAPAPRFAWPVCGKVIVGFAYRVDPVTRRVAFHSGIDLAMPLGVAVRASAAGRIIVAEVRGNYGLMIEIDHGDSYRTRYAHLQTLGVQQGQMVDRGQVIGTVGSSGKAPGPQLHFEIWYHDVVRNPLQYLEQEKTCLGR